MDDILIAEAKMNEFGDKIDFIGKFSSLNKTFTPHLHYLPWWIVAEEKIWDFSYEFQIIRSGAIVHQINFRELQVGAKPIILSILSV